MSHNRELYQHILTHPEAAQAILNSINIYRRLLCHTLYLISREKGRHLPFTVIDRFGPDLRAEDFNLEFPEIFMNQVEHEIRRTILIARHPNLYQYPLSQGRPQTEGSD